MVRDGMEAFGTIFCLVQVGMAGPSLGLGVARPRVAVVTELARLGVFMLELSR